MAAELDDTGRELVLEFSSLARAIAWKYFQKAPGAADFDELSAIAFEALSSAVARYRDGYCAERGYDRDDTSYLAAYLAKRIQGQLYDVARSNDWMTRASRNVQKQLQAAEERGLDRAGQAAEAGVSMEQADRVRAEQAARPVSLDDRLPGAEDGGYAIDEAVDVESSTVVDSVLSAALRVIRELDGAARWLVVLVRYYQLKLDEAAGCLGLDPVKATELYETAVVRIHQGMLRAAT